MKILKKNQIVISVIALMLMTAGYLNFANQNKKVDLEPTSSLADSEMMAGIGDAKLVSANEVTEDSVEIQGSLVPNTDDGLEVDTQAELVPNDDVQINIEQQSNVVNNQVVQEDEYFSQSRLDREKMYSQMLENYQKILETDNLTSEEKQNAQEQITRINNEKNAIMIAENLIKTKGFSDVILFVNNGNVTGVIKVENLDEQAIAQIQNIITRELNVKANKINISSKI